MDLYYIYLIKLIYLYVDHKCVWNLFLFMDLFYSYKYRYPFVCALKCICAHMTYIGI